MVSAFNSEEGSPEATARDDNGSAQPGQVFRPSAIWDEVFSSQASSFEHSSPSISGFPADPATQKDEFAFDFSQCLESDLTPSPEPHNAIVQEGHCSTTSIQTQDGPSRVSLNVRPFSEYGRTQSEQAELGSQIPEGEICPDNFFVGFSETHNVLPQQVQNPFMPSLSESDGMPTEPSFPELICSVCFQPQHRCCFFASYPRANMPPNRTWWDETAEVIRSPTPSACHVDTTDRGIYADQEITSSDADAGLRTERKRHGSDGQCRSVADDNSVHEYTTLIVLREFTIEQRCEATVAV
ncbi:MAG: hypothetical protein M1836_003306 [Candelina mexicana]|nr:MAG: hypothetical protein M1836_003306 [Candelina mexicana]